MYNGERKICSWGDLKKKLWTKKFSEILYHPKKTHFSLR